jgi:hypothetical protein
MIANKPFDVLPGQLLFWIEQNFPGRAKFDDPAHIHKTTNSAMV